MSLINQMLRDLAARRCHPADDPLQVADARSASLPMNRFGWLGLAVLALLLAGLLSVQLGLAPQVRLWSSLQSGTEQASSGGPGPASRSVPAASDTTSPAVAPAFVPAAAAFTADHDRPATIEPGFLPSVDSPLTAVAPSAPQLAELTGEHNLLDLGLWETSAEARLVLEFPTLPDYQLLPEESSNRFLSLLLPATSVGDDLRIPHPAGSLVKTLQLIPQERGLLLLVDLDRAVEFKLLPLPADTFHGERLCLALHPVSQSALPTSQPAPTDHAPAAPVVAPPPLAAKLQKQSAQLSEEEQARQAYQLGLEYLRAGEAVAAEKSFAVALDHFAALHTARLRLSQLLSTSGRRSEARELLKAGLALDPDHSGLRKALARLWHAERRSQEAVALLLAPPQPALADDLEYHALLAALLQELGDYPAAADKYRRLVSKRPDQALWWLGLAIAQEQDGQSESARQAYRQALMLPGLTGELADYARTRLTVL